MSEVPPREWQSYWRFVERYCLVAGEHVPPPCGVCSGDVGAHEFDCPTQKYVASSTARERGAKLGIKLVEETT